MLWFLAFSGCWWAFARTAGALIQRFLKDSPSGHPHIAQGKQRYQLRRILGQAFVANFGKAKLAFDDREGTLCPGAHAGSKLFGLVQQSAPLRLFIQCPAFARAHGHLPINAHSLNSLGGSLDSQRQQTPQSHGRAAGHGFA